jgi:ABC-type dipeptide/oligopeptide/nickel transport system permease subunit
MLTKTPEINRNPLFALANRGFFLWVKYFPRLLLFSTYLNGKGDHLFGTKSYGYAILSRLWLL